MAGGPAADGWTFSWPSSFGSDFNSDFNVRFTKEQQRQGGIEYNYRRESQWLLGDNEGPVAEFAAMTGTDPATYTRERPGMSAFALDAGVVYHTYSTYAHGLDVLWGMYQWLDRAPPGRQRDRRHLVAPPRRVRPALSRVACDAGRFSDRGRTVLFRKGGVRPDEIPAPQAWLECDVARVETATAKSETLGCRRPVKDKKKPWGRIVSRFPGPEGLLVGITPSLRKENSTLVT